MRALHHSQPVTGQVRSRTNDYELVSQYQKGKTSLDLVAQEVVSGSDIRWAICETAP